MPHPSSRLRVAERWGLGLPASPSTLQAPGLRRLTGGGLATLLQRSRELSTGSGAGVAHQERLRPWAHGLTQQAPLLENQTLVRARGGSSRVRLPGLPWVWWWAEGTKP